MEFLGDPEACAIARATAPPFDAVLADFEAAPITDGTVFHKLLVTVLRDDGATVTAMQLLRLGPRSRGYATHGSAVIRAEDMPVGTDVARLRAEHRRSVVLEACCEVSEVRGDCAYDAREAMRAVRRARALHGELAAAAWRPSRHVDWCLAEDERVT